MSESKPAQKFTVVDIIFGVTTSLGILAHFYYAFFSEANYSLQLLLLGALFLYSSSYFFYKTITKVSKDPQLVGSLWLAIIVSLVWFDLYVAFTPVSELEESSISWRFNVLRNQTDARVEKESDKGDLEQIQLKPPEKARRDINIIGITTKTLDQLGGVWPLPWKYYAKIIDKFASSTNHLMFDVFFLDYKPGQTDEMAKALSGNPRVMFDYPMETSLESKSTIINLEKGLRSFVNSNWKM